MAPFADAPTTCAVDVGSSRVKASLWHGTDEILATSVRPYPLQQPPQVGVDHAAVRATFVAVIRDVCKTAAPDAVAVTSQMAGLAMLDHNERPVGPLLSGVDTKVPQQRLPEELTISGCAEPTISTVAKYLWWKQTSPEHATGVRRVGGVKEFLLHALTGQWATDRSSASASGFYDLYARDWSATTLALAGLSTDLLPKIQEMDAVIGGVQSSAAAECGVPSGTPVLAGLGDGPAANIAVGAVGDGVMCLSHGTTVVARVLVRGEVPPLPLPTFVHHVAGPWNALGVRFTVDAQSGVLIPAGRHRDRVQPPDLSCYLRPMTDAFDVIEIRALGGRHLELPARWHVRAASETDGSRALALVANGLDLDHPNHGPGVRRTGGY